MITRFFNASRSMALVVLFLLISCGLRGQVNVLLNIPGRLQWDNANGYCGEESIQMIGLFYGNYISQDICRKAAGGELLVAENDRTALTNLAFTYEEWDFNQTAPQYQAYLVWVKQHLANSHPVMITVFVKGMHEADYDHIIPAIGVSSSDTNIFHDTDQLMFNDCYERSYYTRTFQSLWDTRSMNGNGARHEYCIPKNIDYGCAITGIIDPRHETLPVSITLDRWDEPNVTLGKTPALLNATITISGLTAGTRYSLIRYNTYSRVPTTGFDPLTADGARYFTAASDTKTFTDNFMSNTAVFYRCIPYNYVNGMEQRVLADLNLSVYPNPLQSTATLHFILSEPQRVSLRVFNVLGQVVQEIPERDINSGPCQIPISGTSLPPGSYFCQVRAENMIKTIRIEVVKN